MNSLFYSKGIKFQKPLIDLIVLSHNGIKVSKVFLDRFYQNTDETKVRIIWVENGSTDGSQDILKEYINKKSNFVISIGNENLGVIGGRNHGKQISDYLSKKFHSPKYLMILDNDQFVQPGWLEDHVKFIKSNNLDLAGVEAWVMNNNFIPVSRLECPRGSFHYVGCGGSLIKKEVVDAIGLYDEIFNPAYFEDPDFTFRALDAGYKVGCNFHAKITHLPHQTLGKLNREEKNKRFIDSLRKFRLKWKGKKLRAIKANLIHS